MLRFDKVSAPGSAFNARGRQNIDTFKLLKNTTIKDYIKKRILDEDDKVDGVTIRDTIGREQNPIVINEPGLYKKAGHPLKDDLFVFLFSFGAGCY